MFGEECTLPMDIGPKQQLDLPDSITSPYAICVRDALEVAYDQVRQHSGLQKRLYDRRAVMRLFAVGDWVMRYYTPAKKCKLYSAWIGPYLIVSGSQESPTSIGGRILASNEAIIDCPIGSDPRCQYYATNVAEFTIINGCGPGRRSNHRRCRFGTLGWFFSGS